MSAPCKHEHQKWTANMKRGHCQDCGTQLGENQTSDKEHLIELARRVWVETGHPDAAHLHRELSAVSARGEEVERMPLLEIELMRATLDVLDEVEALRRGAAVTHVGLDPVERLRFHTPSRDFLDKTEAAIRAADTFVPQPHRHPGPVAGCRECEREAVTRYVNDLSTKGKSP